MLFLQKITNLRQRWGEILLKKLHTNLSWKVDWQSINKMGKKLFLIENFSFKKYLVSWKKNWTNMTEIQKRTLMISSHKILVNQSGTSFPNAWICWSEIPENLENSLVKDMYTFVPVLDKFHKCISLVQFLCLYKQRFEL